MTPEEIKLLFAYNSWANNRVFEAVAALSPEVYAKDLKAAHGSIRGTLTHLVAAEKIWLSRWIGKPESILLKEADAQAIQDLKAVWEDVAGRTARFVARVDPAKLASSFAYTSTEGKRFTQTYQQSLQHLVNHSTYHRGQISTLMRQAGAQPVGTDLIMFYRLTAQPGPKG
jgi:uncharacterized damage-inducible protein DinB